MNIKRIQVEFSSKRDRTYSVLIGFGLVDVLVEHLGEYTDIYRFAIISDDLVGPLYAQPILNALKARGLNAELFLFPAGEAHKNQETKTRLDHELLKHEFGRDSMIVAVGGGVVGDLAGYVAATYMRGIPYVHVPSTLLAMVDSSIGGKTGINTPYGKNLIGAFHQPKLVLQDLDFIKDLPSAQLANGLFEAIKIFCTSDPEMFAFVIDKREQILAKDQESLLRVVERAVEIKAGIVSADEHEANERMLVNFGHTIGHALELLLNYQIPHGSAVALGIIVETKIAELSGIARQGLSKDITEAFLNYGLGPEPLRSLQPKDIVEATRKDKKTRKGLARYVLLEDIGRPHKVDGKCAHVVDERTVQRAIEELSKSLIPTESGLHPSQ